MLTNAHLNPTSNNPRQQTTGFAQNAVVGLHVNLEMLTSPLLALSTRVQGRPDVAAVGAWFEDNAKRVFEAVRRRAAGGGAAAAEVGETDRCSMGGGDADGSSRV